MLIKFPTLTLAVTATLLAQTGTAPQPAPFERVDGALATAAKDPLGAVAQRYATLMRAQLGGTNDDTFAVINAQQDDIGGTHVRMQQYFKGLKVVGGEIISHNIRGEYQRFTNSLKTGINIGTTPGLSKTAAIAYLDHANGAPGGPYVAPPKAELVILPIMERYVIATGMPYSPPRPVLTSPAAEKPAPTSGDEELPSPVNAAATARRVKEYRLAYEIRTARKVPDDSNAANLAMFYVDANTGEVIRQRSLHDSAIGQGSGQFHKNVEFVTKHVPGHGYLMWDDYRNFGVMDWDTRFAFFSPVDYDSDNTWGDGKKYAGDGQASLDNTQSAMVDCMFGATVYWDMLANVFGRKGPNGKFFEVPLYPHYGSNWNNAEYIDGEIHVGDGDGKQALSVIAHEEGHGLVDFTAKLAWNEAQALNESAADIFGAMATFYLKGGKGAFGKHSTTIPDDFGSWTVGGRNMQKPSLSSPPIPDYWKPGIGDLDPHIGAGPNDRMFYFLSKGASSYLSLDDYSPLTEWGFGGVGNQNAARIWYDALTLYMTSDSDYNDARTACFLAAFFRFGPVSKEVEAVQNAFAAINVGPPAAGYPAPPAALFEPAQKHDTWPTAIRIARPKNAQSGSPDKVWMLGGGSTEDWYFVELGPMEQVAVRLEALSLSDYDIHLYSLEGFSLVEVDHSIKSKGYADTVKYLQEAGMVNKQMYFIRVNLYSTQVPSPQYLMRVDLSGYRSDGK